MTTVADSRATDKVDSLNAITEIGRTKVSGGDVDSASLSQRQGLGVKCGVARYDHYTGSRS
uniref:Uncharacterized protein n=1 Tax=Arion vulgaris TaxID=1028688 RepID=A0A0B7ACW3_9EUPU